MSIKRRERPFYGPNAIYRRRLRGPFPVGTSPPYDQKVDNSAYWKPWTGVQTTESENHWGWDQGFVMDGEIRNYEPQDRGGNFTSQKTYVVSPYYVEPQFVDSGWVKEQPNNTWEYRETAESALLPLSIDKMPFPPSGRSSESDLEKLGTTAIARCAPTNQVAQLAVALTELYRDGLPKVLGHATWKARVDGARKAGSSASNEYLNVQFGWQPLISDIKDVSLGIKRSDDIYNRYLSNAGKRVRRRYVFSPVESTVNTTVATNATPVLVGGRDSTKWHNGAYNLGTVVRSRYTLRRQWFSGAFSYHIPKQDDGWLGHVERASSVLGLKINAETLWNVAPWSWAVDWFGNTGDVIHNVSSWADDGLVLLYGYIMEHSFVRDEYSFTGFSNWKPNYLTTPARVVLVNETKLRRRATPFGFGLSFNALTHRQKAIAAALGVSRVR
jgi:hypothetical protein